MGLANIAGTLLAGWAGNHFPKKYLLAAIYTARTLAAAAFILLPITPLSVIVFSLVMGSLWLATVPLTSGLVAHLYGLRYMGTLYGIIFFSHQIGSFLGVWLGGRMYDVSTATTPWSGGSALPSAPSAPSSTCPSAKTGPLQCQPDLAGLVPGQQSLGHQPVGPALRTGESDASGHPRD